MTLHDSITLLSSAAYIGLAVLAASRIRRNGLAFPLLLLSLDLFVWNAATLAYDLTGRVGWHWVDRAFSPLTAPITLHLVAVFIGRRRPLRAWLVAAYGAFGLLGLATALAFVLPTARAFAGSGAWAVLLVAGSVPTIGAGVALLLAHLRDTTGGEERARTRLMIASLLVGVLALIDPLYGLGVAPVRLGNATTLASTLLLAASALGFQLLEGLPAVSRAERLDQLATLGRFSAQMGHDLKNPLAALKGAVQFLKEERTQGRPWWEQEKMLDLIVDQIERLAAVVDLYGRLGRVEPFRVPLTLNDLVRGVLALQGFAASPSIQVRASLAEDLPSCRADRDLLACALENLVRNAFEAMPRGGTVTVRTEPAELSGARAVAVSVEDTGLGMGARTRERAFEDFFTTKPGGTGHGLAFVRRVADAHGGEVSLTSREGRGTVVRLSIPAEEPARSKG